MTSNVADRSLVLATDLDGTFLGGSDEQRSRFYAYLQDHRDALMLLFVTGRDLDLVRQLYDEPNFPRPDYIIGDVGTTVASGKDFAPLDVVQNWIAEQWGDSGDRVRELLQDEPGLERQPGTPRYRVSYYYDEKRLSPTTLDKIDRAGFDVIQSDDRFLDVMPRGVAKGSTLLKTLAALGLARDRTVVAGDTLNDRSLFETGLNGIVVGNAEAKLQAFARDRANVYVSSEPGASGIWEGLKHYGKAFD